VLLGVPFTPDDMVPPPRSRRVAQLARLGVPEASIVELYRGDDLYEELAALRDTARERGWRRVLFLLDPLGTRRPLMIANRAFGEAGIAVGQTTFPVSWLDPQRWYLGGTPRTLVFLRATQLFFTLVSNRA